MSGQMAGIEIQERDLAVLTGLFESRVMTLAHIAALYFDGRAEAAKKRVQKLKVAGLVGERARRVREPSVLFITKRAFDALKRAACLDQFPDMTWASLEKRVRVSDQTLRHELEVMDVKAAFVNAVRKQANLELAEFSTWPLLYEFRALTPTSESVLVRPDGFIRIHEKDAAGGVYEHMFFLEVDRSTESQSVLAMKAHCYRDFYVRGGLAERNGRPAPEYEQFPFRVLMVFRTEARRNNTAARLLQLTPPVRTQAWLTTAAAVSRDPLGVIWVRPADLTDRSPDGGHAGVSGLSLFAGD